jgi:branched-chain amino acid transport system ATP-binding protein
MTLAVENLRAAYGEIEVLHGVNLTVAKGQIVALLGANGAGKSTVIKAIMGLVKPTAGRILLDGRDLSDRRRTWRRAPASRWCRKAAGSSRR